MYEPAQSITDQYLADLEDLQDAASEVGSDSDDEEMGEDEEFDEDAAEFAALKAAKLDTGVGVWNTEKFQKHIKLVNERMELPPPVDSDAFKEDEYDLVVQSNAFLVELDNEIVAINKVIRDLYATKFPELESLIVNPLDYARVVKRIGNEMDPTVIDLNGLLPSATIMVVSVTASTTTGTLLPEETLERVMTACDQVLELDSGKRRMLEFIESRMCIIAPNMCQLVGSSVAAQLMIQAGGVSNLARMPACNIQLLGAKKKHQTGLSFSGMPRSGFLHTTDLTVKCPPLLKKKCVKILAGKIALLARVDSCHEDSSGHIGRVMREEVEKKLEKLQEPPPAKKPKALAAPDEKRKKRRGGKRLRKMKEKMALSELAKQANRVAFGVAEEEVFFGGDRTKGLGMVGLQHQSGKLRVSAKEQKIRLSEKAKQRRGLTAASSGATGGISSTVTMTATQGMIFEEMHTDGTGTVTPARLMPVQKQNLKYFGGSTIKDLKRDG